MMHYYFILSLKQIRPYYLFLHTIAFDYTAGRFCNDG